MDENSTHPSPAAASQEPRDGCQDEEKRSKFGNRYLTDPQNVFQHNAWDNVVWDEEQEAEARKVVMTQAEKAVSQDKRDELERQAAQHWDQFYSIHQNHFFKDRHWLFTEFPELHGGVSPPSAVEKASDCLPDNVDPFPNKVTPEQQKNMIDESESVADTLSNSIDSKNEISEVKADKECEGHSGLDTSSSRTVPSPSEPPSGRSAPDLTSVPESAAPPSSQLSHLHLSQDDNPSFRLLEVGCGVGNTVFPILTTNKNPNLMVYCCDFSSTAVEIVKNHPDYDPQRCHAFVYDITDESTHVPIQPASLDLIIMIFVLSAVCPTKMQSAVNRLVSFLKPGGMLVFRDYGRYDMAQLRFKDGRCLSENFYVRGDGTRVYFFTQGELQSMFQKAGLREKENLVDRRLQVNRGRQLKMYRVWIQCKYTKPEGGDHR